MKFSPVEYFMVHVLNYVQLYTILLFEDTLKAFLLYNNLQAHIQQKS